MVDITPEMIREAKRILERGNIAELQTSRKGIIVLEVEKHKRIESEQEGSPKRG